MSRDSGPADGGLEQSCSSPGVWLIEGYDVRRMNHNSPRRRWQIYRFGQWIYEAQTLAACREWIATEIHR